jgi:hypothetical protein
VLALRVEILLAKGKTENARTIAEGAVRMHPDHGRCHYALALVEVAAENLTSAKESLAAAFTTAPALRAVALDDGRLKEFWRGLGSEAGGIELGNSCVAS